MGPAAGLPRAHGQIEGHQLAMGRLGNQQRGSRRLNTEVAAASAPPRSFRAIRHLQAPAGEPGRAGDPAGRLEQVRQFFTRLLKVLAIRICACTF